MNTDCIFNVLLYSNPKTVVFTFFTAKINNKISTNYFWKLLYERDYYYLSIIIKEEQWLIASWIKRFSFHYMYCKYHNLNSYTYDKYLCPKIYKLNKIDICTFRKIWPKYLTEFYFFLEDEYYSFYSE